MTTETQYQVYCVEEQANVTFWSKVKQNNCPNDYRHHLDPTKTIKLATRTSEVQGVSIQQESTNTNGNYRYKCIKYDCASNGEHEYDISFPYPITILEVETQTNESHRGDKLGVNFYTSNNTLGFIASNVNIGDSNIFVTNSVINYINQGFHCILDNNTITEDLHEIISIQPMSNLLITKNASSNFYDYTTPTKLKYHVPIIEDMYMSDPRTYSVGRKKITGSSLPANAVLRMTYSNSSPNSNKELIVSFEYMY